jgi:hypothetical protein
MKKYALAFMKEDYTYTVRISIHFIFSQCFAVLNAFYVS